MVQFYDDVCVVQRLHNIFLLALTIKRVKTSKHKTRLVEMYGA